MTAKEYLRRVEHAEREIGMLRARIRHYEEMGMNITSHFSDTPVKGSRGASRVEAASVGIVDTMQSLNANLRAYEAIVHDAEVMIGRVPQEKYRQLLTLRYLCGMSLRSVGDEMRYQDRNSVYRAHGWALLEFQRVLNQSERD